MSSRRRSDNKSNSNKSGKRIRYENANVDYLKSTSDKNETKILRVPKPGQNYANQLLILNNHINWLETKIKKEFGDIACLVRGQDPPPILDPVAVGQPIPQSTYQPPETPSATPAATPIVPGVQTRGSSASSSNVPARIPVILMTQARHDKETDKAVEKRDKREEDISKALGAILETIDDSFRIYRNSTAQCQAAYDNNDIKTIMAHISIWFKSALGSNAQEQVATSESDLKKARDTFQHIRQHKNQSIQDFKAFYDAHVKFYQQTTGEVLPESRKAYLFLDKLHKPKYGAWFNQMDEYEQKFNLIRARNANVVRDETRCVPATLDLAYAIAQAHEADLLKKEKTAELKRSREESKNTSDKEKVLAPEGGQTSYAKVNKNKGKHDGYNKNKNKNNHEPGKKAPNARKGPCRNWNHEPGDNLDHHWDDCPIPKGKKRDRGELNRAGVQDSPDSPPHDTPNVTFDKTSYASHSQRSALSHLSRNELEEIVLQYTNKSKYANMMVFNYMMHKANTYTLLLDTCGSDHDMSNPAFKFNVRPNPDADVPIETIMGTYHCQEICTTPFLGRAGSNDSGKLNIISLGRLHETPNIDIDSNKKISVVKITFELLNLTITFKMCKGRRILVGDGKPLADLIQEYNELCKEKHLSMIEALDSSVHINQLRDPTFRCNILTKMAMIRGYNEDELLPASQPPVKVSRAGIKIDKSEFVTKLSILLAQRARDLITNAVPSATTNLLSRFQMVPSI